MHLITIKRHLHKELFQSNHHLFFNLFKHSLILRTPKLRLIILNSILNITDNLNVTTIVNPFHFTLLHSLTAADGKPEV